MNFVLSAVGEAGILDGAVVSAGDGAFKTVKVGLYSAAQSLNRGMTIAALTPATDTNLDDLKAVTWEADNHENSSANGRHLNGSTVINYSAAAVSDPPDVIVGFYMVDSVDPTILLGAAAFDEAVTVSSLDQEISFVVQLSCGSGAIGGTPTQL